MANVLLLRAPSPLEDRYEKTLTEAGYCPLSIAVLETVTTNLPELKSLIAAGPGSRDLDGVIMTSARSCESWKNAVGGLIQTSQLQVSTEEGSWKQTVFYVVGEATASALGEVSKMYGDTPFTPSIVKGQSSGTGEKLAHFILDQPKERPKTLLYLTGDKNRDTVPSILGAAGIKLQSMKVYETQGLNTFDRDLQTALEKAKPDRWWIVHFAPSASDFVVPILNRQLPTNVPKLVAAIGPATATHLEKVLGIHVDVISQKPSPRDLLNAIQAKDGEL